MKRKQRLQSLIGKPIPYRLNTWFGRHDYRRLKRKLMRLWKYTGKSYHIIPLDNGQVTIMDNDFRKKYNKGVKKSERISYYKLLQIAYFSTPMGRRKVA